MITWKNRFLLPFTCGALPSKSVKNTCTTTTSSLEPKAPFSPLIAVMSQTTLLTRMLILWLCLSKTGSWISLLTRECHPLLARGPSHLLTRWPHHLLTRRWTKAAAWRFQPTFWRLCYWSCWPIGWVLWLLPLSFSSLLQHPQEGPLLLPSCPTCPFLPKGPWVHLFF